MCDFFKNINPFNKKGFSGVQTVQAFKLKKHKWQHLVIVIFNVVLAIILWVYNHAMHFSYTSIIPTQF